MKAFNVIVLLTLLLLVQNQQVHAEVPEFDFLAKPPVLAVDTDADGVVDYVDQCAFTERGAKVDERGCYVLIQEQKEITLKVNFAFDSDEIESYFTDDVQAVADFMREYPLTRVEIEGHTDSDGTEAYNLELSQRRAQAVGLLLVNSFGVPANRLTAVGYGETKPMVSNNTDANKAKNRRVVAVIRAAAERRL